jgi:hypothetical protein
MTPSPDRPKTDEPATEEEPGSTREHETPDVGLISDEDLPEDLQPTEDNPLAQDPDTDEPGKKGDAAPGAKRVEGMPDAGEPGTGG